MAYNNPVQKKESPCKQLTSETGKPSGLMMEGSVAYQESEKQEKKNLMKDMPVDDKASAVEMSPYKMHNKEHLQKVGKDMPVHMDHEGSPATFTGMSGGSALQAHCMKK